KPTGPSATYRCRSPITPRKTPRRRSSPRGAWSLLWTTNSPPGLSPGERMTPAITAVCERCACTVAVELGVIQCPHCGGALSIPTDPVTAEHLAKLSAPGLWRYAELFPPLGPSITLGEPTTPVVSVPWGDHPGVSFK